VIKINEIVHSVPYYLHCVLQLLILHFPYFSGKHHGNTPEAYGECIFILHCSAKGVPSEYRLNSASNRNIRPLFFKLLWALAKNFKYFESHRPRSNFGTNSSCLYLILYMFNDHAISQGEVVDKYSIAVGRLFQMFPDIYCCDKERISC
jgi:hypothetical protein